MIRRLFRAAISAGKGRTRKDPSGGESRRQSLCGAHPAENV